ncbi:MAG: S-layer homology domain-containing protein [Aphanothece sp. CMT-3BRIN-NPC111]|jgi:hypothetical protein|nr:S-layer homology domain-containing protein [Aphanothece sp. CMT-3BRIN-NPC111]
MSRFPTWSSGSAALIALGMATSAVAPIVISAPATAASFSDVNSHWARPFIEALANERIINGYPDGTFKPDQPVSRAEFAALVQAAFSPSEVRSGTVFNDVPSNYWARSAIQKAYRTGFMSGYPNSQFRPNEKIPRVQAIVSLASGLRLEPQGSTSTILRTYRDANDIPEYAEAKVAAATEKRIVVSYPNVTELDPNQQATRADVAAFIYQALVNRNELQPLASSLQASQYIVGSTSTNNGGNNGNTQTASLRVPKSTLINVMYEPTDRLAVAPGETVNMTLMVATDIKNTQGDVLIPRNSQIQGQLVPRYNGSQFLGTQFVAQNLVIRNESYSNLNATSPLLTAQQPTATNVNQGSLQNVAVTAAAQAILGRVTGQPINFGNILTSVLTGQNPNTQTQPQAQNQLIIIDPEADLRLTVGSDFYVRSVASAGS